LTRVSRGPVVGHCVYKLISIYLSAFVAIIIIIIITYTYNYIRLMHGLWIVRKNRHLIFPVCIQ